jgi:hypothetical protein
LQKTPPIEPLITGWLDKRGAVVLAGETGSNKSLVLLDWMLCLAFGFQWLGCDVPEEPVRSLLIIGEGQQGLMQRVNAWQQAHGVRGKEMRQVWSEYIRVTARPYASLASEHEHDAVWDEIRDVALAEQVGFVGLDTMSSLAPDIDETGDAAMMMNHLVGLADAIDGCALLVHHAGWVEKGRVRGGSQFEANADGVLIAQKEEDNLVTLWRKKNKDGEAGAKLQLVRKIPESGEGVVLAVADGSTGLDWAQRIYTAVARYITEHSTSPNSSQMWKAVGLQGRTSVKPQHKQALKMCVKEGWLVPDYQPSKQGQPTFYSLGNTGPS